MLTCALCVVPVAAAPLVEGNYYIGGSWFIEAKWIAVLLIGVAAAAHQGWSCNMFTLASDMFPRGAVGSVVGIAGMSGAIGGQLIPTADGLPLQPTRSHIAGFPTSACQFPICTPFESTPSPPPAA